MLAKFHSASSRCQSAVLAATAVLSLLCCVTAQAGNDWFVCRDEKDGARLPGADCNQFVTCSKGKIATIGNCTTGNFNPRTRTCESGFTCSAGAARGLWRQAMPSSGLVAIHCTLLPGTGLVAIWHRGLMNVNDIPWNMKQPGSRRGSEYMSAVIDPVQNRAQGYVVAPSFCGGHVQLPDATGGAILSCGGEPRGFNGRGDDDKENGINSCRILKCKTKAPVTVKDCNWTTIAGTMSANRWYPGMILFPGYNDTVGPFALVMGGTKMGWDSSSVGDVDQKVDWVFPFARPGQRWRVTPPTTFTMKLQERNLYPQLYLMPFRSKGRFVMFQWGIDYGELAAIEDPTTAAQPVQTHRILPTPLPNQTVATTYPTGGCVILHPLEYPWDLNAKVTMFGGHKGPVGSKVFQSFNNLQGSINANSLASNTAYTLDLRAINDGKNVTWEEELMPDAATMRTCISLPNGKILLFHGVRKGRMTSTPAGFGCGREQVFNVWMYNPKAPNGQRFTVDPSQEPTFRAYHSCGLLMPDGSLFGAGGDTAPVEGNWATCNATRKLYYNVDQYFTPSNYRAMLTKSGPYIKSAPAFFYYNQTHNISFTGDVDECSLVTPGAQTHQIEQSSRVVFLRPLGLFNTTVNNVVTKWIQVQMPMDPAVIMRGQHMLFCSFRRDQYSQGTWVTVGYK